MASDSDVTAGTLHASGAPVLPPTSALTGDSLATIALLPTSSLTTLVQQDIERAILAGRYAPRQQAGGNHARREDGRLPRAGTRSVRMLEEAGLVRTEKTAACSCVTSPSTKAIEIF